MKSIVSAFFTGAMLVASIGGASATSWIQASSTEEQVASDAKPKVVTMNSTDGAKNIKMEKGVVTFNEAGAFFVMAAAQVGGKTKGLVRMWIPQYRRPRYQTRQQRMRRERRTIVRCQKSFC